MTDKITLDEIKESIEKVEARGFGEVVVKIKNGYVHRIIETIDTILDNDS